MNLSSTLWLGVAGVFAVLLLVFAIAVWIWRRKSEEAINAPTTAVDSGAEGNKLLVEAGSFAADAGSEDNWGQGEDFPVLANLVGRISPDLKTLVELGHFAKKMDFEETRGLSGEERFRVLQEAVDELTARQPDNPMLRRMKDMLDRHTGEAFSTPDGGEAPTVYRAGGKTVIRYQNIEYDNVEDIPDPDIRESIRQTIADLEKKA